MIAAQVTALLIARNSFGIAPWLYGALVILCMTAVAWIAHERLHRHLRSFALAETLGTAVGMWIGLLLLSPPVNRYATNEPFVLDFIVFATLVGAGVGAASRLLIGAAIGLLDQEVVDALRPWLWLLGAIIALAALGGLLLGDRTSVVLGLAPTIISGSALAGWIAQCEYLRLEPDREPSKE